MLGHRILENHLLVTMRWMTNQVSANLSRDTKRKWWNENASPPPILPTIVRNKLDSNAPIVGKFRESSRSSSRNYRKWDESGEQRNVNMRSRSRSRHSHEVRRRRDRSPNPSKQSERIESKSEIRQKTKSRKSTSQGEKPRVDYSKFTRNRWKWCPQPVPLFSGTSVDVWST